MKEGLKYIILLYYIMTHFLGAHVSSSIGFITAAKLIKESGGNLIQMFVASPVTGPLNGKVRHEDEYDKFNKYIKANKMLVVVHASYTINLAADWDKYSWWVRSLILEIELAGRINAYAVVVHLGKQMELTIENAYNNMFTSLIYVHNQTKQYSNVKILLETSSGQGSEMCTSLETLAYFYKKISRHRIEDIKERFKLCVDSCHIFAAGYDIRNKDNIKNYLNAFEELIGLKHIKLIHLNDSQKELGSNLDRHEDIGMGYIGKVGLVEFYKYFKKIGVPIVLETPDPLSFIESAANIV